MPENSPPRWEEGRGRRARLLVWRGPSTGERLGGPPSPGAQAERKAVQRMCRTGPLLVTPCGDYFLLQGVRGRGRRAAPNLKGEGGSGGKRSTSKSVVRACKFVLRGNNSGVGDEVRGGGNCRASESGQPLVIGGGGREEGKREEGKQRMGKWGNSRNVVLGPWYGEEAKRLEPIRVAEMLYIESGARWAWRR